MTAETERSVPPPQLAPVPDEVERQRRLDQMKSRATGLLVLATAIYIVTRLLEPRYAWLGFLRAMAEAAMIGGLADWFAVTALFRHPMGIPIPHTAIIPARKDRVARTLGQFVQHNFLTREVIQARLAGVHVGERIARWVAQPENARTIARQTASALAAGAQVLKDDDVQALIDHTLEERIRRARIAPIAGKLLSVVTEDNRHQELLDEAIVLISRSVEQNHDLIRDRVQRADEHHGRQTVHQQAGVQPGTEPASAFPTDDAWGYVIAGRFDYNNALGPVNLFPRFSWAHDVDGTSPGPGGQFIDGRQALTIGLGFQYQINLEWDLSWTQYMGAGRYNLIHVRAFVAANIKYSF